MAYVQRFKERFPERNRPESIIAYFSSKNKIDSFSEKQITDEEFPGISFFKNENSARKKNPYVTKVSLEMKKTVPLYGKIKRSDAEYLIHISPNREEVIKTYGDDHREAYFKAVDDMMKGTTIDAFLKIYKTFYENDPREFLKQMMKLGYDGIMFDDNQILFNPQRAKIMS